MPGPNRTQKEFAQSYRGNLAYLKKFHFFRTLRGVCFLLAVVGSLTLAFGYRSFFGEHKEYFSTGPISANHAKFANRCDVCHGDEDLGKKLNVEEALAKAKEMKVSDVTKLASLVGLKVGDGAETIATPTAEAHNDAGANQGLLHE